MNPILPPLLGFALATTSALAGSSSFYREAPLFSTAPDEKTSVQSVDRFGPVGIGIELHQPAFVMMVKNVEDGSPAAATGKLKKGQIIESINGQQLKEIDPRIQLGGIISAAEAADGVVKLMVKESPEAIAQEVLVRIPVLGAYHKTWPLDCPKSDQVVRQFADYLSKPESEKGFAGAGMLLLLSTGDDKDLAPVREWVRGLGKQKSSGYAWHLGFGGIPLCEYYLRTGDAEAMPVIQSWVDAATKGEYLDAWAGRGGVTKLGYGNGHLNAGGTAVVTFLLLAKQCGANVDESLLRRTLVHFFRYAGRGNNPYGDDRPETSFVDNGKNGNLAFAMAAAASLTPEGEKSIYARARDVAAMSGFYTTTFMLHGHTGGGIGEIWRSAAMSLLREKKPLQYREFMDHRQWHYELSRRFDGSCGILGGAGYDNIEWGECYPWAYTFPRKTLRVTGAPPSRFSKLYQLPERPWGTAADDAFLSLDPAADKEGKRHDVSQETLAEDSAKPLIRRLNAVKELGDDEIRRYVRHPEYLIRNMLANHAAGLTIDYMFTKTGPRVRPALLEEFARDPDPRVRNAGLRAAIKAFDPTADWSRRLFDLAIERLKDDAESWWIKDACLALVACGTPDMIVPHVDLFLSYLKHPEQWLQNGALNVLTVVITDERCHAKVIPPVGEILRTTPRQSTTGGPIRAIRAKMPAASPKVRELAIKTLGDAYQNYSGTRTWPGGQDLTGHRKETLEVLAGALADVPGGHDVLYQIVRKQYPDDPLPYDEIFLKANPEQFGPELKNAILPIIREKLIYEYIGKNRGAILADLQMKTQRGTVTNSLDGLVDLYQKIGVRDYDWKPFGPDLKNARWHYFTFDPPEKQPYDKSPWRYRPVTWPQGMDNWFSPEFDPSKAGWKQGQFPIGQYQGKLADNRAGGRNPWTEPPRTLWEHEVLLVRGTFGFPVPQPGHIHRIRVQTGQGVGAGDGFKVWFNGEPLVESKEGLGRRAGDNIRGAWINPELAQALGTGPVTIAATSFLRYGDRAIVQMPPVPQGIFSMWLETRKLPPLDSTAFRKAAAFVPMTSAAWQTKQDPQNAELQTDDDLFRYDGKFVPNPELSGKWTVVSLVPELAAFDPAKPANPGRAPIKSITFRDDGTTDSDSFIWSGDTLIDMDRWQALKITKNSVAATPYLFIEAGGFNAKNPPGWKSPLVVMKKVTSSE